MPMVQTKDGAEWFTQQQVDKLTNKRLAFLATLRYLNESPLDTPYVLRPIAEDICLDDLPWLPKLYRSRTRKTTTGDG